MIREELVSLAKRFEQARKQYPAYRSSLLWFFKDIWTAFPWPMIRLSAMAVLGASLQGAVLLGSIQYIGLLEADAEIVIGQAVIMARSSGSVLLASLSFFLLLSLSAWMLYYSGSLSSRLIGSYHAFMLKRAVIAFHGSSGMKLLNRPYSDIARKVTDEMVHDTQRAAFLTRFLTGTISSLVILFYSLPALFYIDPFLTILLLLTILLFMPFFYHANVLAYKSDFMLKQSGKNAKNELQGLIRDAGDYQYISDEHRSKIDGVFSKSSLNTRINALPTYFLSLVRTELLTNVLLGLTVALVIAFKVPDSLAGSFAWTMLLAYLIFLRLGVNAFRSVMLFLIKFSRSYPHIRRYRNFLISSLKEPEQNSNIIIKASKKGIQEHEDSLSIQNPCVLSLLTDIELCRYNFPYMVDLLSESESGIAISPKECFFVTSKPPQRGGSLREMLNLPEDFTSNDLKKSMPYDVYAAVKNHIGSSLDKKAGEFRWNRLSHEHIIELSIVSALLSPARAVVISKSVLDRVKKERRGEILAQLKMQSILTIINYPISHLKLKASAEYGEDICAVVSLSGNILALGSPDWVYMHSGKILDILQRENVSISKDQSTGNEISEEDT